MNYEFTRNIPVEEKLEDLIAEKIPFYEGLSFEKKVKVVQKIIKGCKGCKLSVETPYHPMAPLIKEGSQILFVGRNPRKEEYQKGSLFSAETQVGQIFDKYLNLLEVSREEISIANMVNCCTHGNRPPESFVINHCSAFKKLEWDLLEPTITVVIPLGTDALHWVRGGTQDILTILGEYYYKQALFGKRDILIIPVLHPAHILIDPSHAESVFKILTKGKDLIEKQLERRS